jgi:predicted enzyme related to lactoylglutathione lyase
MANAINWFEIPATNFQRAKKFYETIFNIEMTEQPVAGFQMAFFPWTPGEQGVSGAICTGEHYTPSADGAKLYLNGGDDLSGVLNRVQGAGGQIAIPKTQISPEYGYMAFFIDTEGNMVGLHSQN